MAAALLMHRLAWSRLDDVDAATHLAAQLSALAGTVTHLKYVPPSPAPTPNPHPAPVPSTTHHPPTLPHPVASPSPRFSRFSRPMPPSSASLGRASPLSMHAMRATPAVLDAFLRALPPAFVNALTDIE